MKPVDPKRLAQMKKLAGLAGGGGPAGYMDPKTGKLRSRKLPPTFAEAAASRQRLERLQQRMRRIKGES